MLERISKKKYIELGEKSLHHLKNKELLKRAFKDGIYNSYGSFDNFLEEIGYFTTTYTWYFYWYQVFLEAAYSKTSVMEKKILSLFVSLPLDDKGVVIFNELFYYYDNSHLFGVFWHKLSKSPVLDELFIYCSEFFLNKPSTKKVIEILTLLRTYYPYSSNYGKWRKIVYRRIHIVRTIPLLKTQ